MNNIQMNFDPITGQPINQNISNNQEFNQLSSNLQQVTTPIEPMPAIEPITPVQQVPIIENTLNTQQQMQNIPTVEQSKQEFISNTQILNTEKKEEKKNNSNIIFIAVLFIIIFAAIFFLFPFLLKVL